MKNQDRLYFSDRKNNVVSQELPINFAKAVSSIANNDRKSLDKCIKKLSDQYIDKIARFLVGIDDLKTAFEIVKNHNLKFDYAIKIGKIEEAISLAEKNPSGKKWKQIGDLSLQSGDFDQAEFCFKSGNDYSSLFLLYSSLGNLFTLILQKVTKKGSNG